VAEDEKKAEGQAEDGEQKSSKKGLIIMVVVAVLAIAVSVGVTLFLLGGDESEEAEVEETEQAEVKIPAIYMDIKPAFLITLDDNGRQRYMQIHMSVSSRDQAVVDAVEHHLPYIKSKINALYSSQSFAQVQTLEGKEALREQSLSTINEVLAAEGEGEIENVFFTNFVLQ